MLIIHISLFIFTLYKKRERQTVTLLLSNISFAYIFEYFVFNVFQSYRYKPSLLKKRQLDNALGALLSQAIYIPITATFITVFQIGLKGKLLFTMYFYLIEHFFLKLRNYQLNWWKPGYTSMLLPVYFALSDFWNKKLSSNKKSILWLSTYLSIGVVTKTLAFIFDILKKQKIGLGNRHSWQEHFLISPLYMFIFVWVALLPAINKNLLTQFFSLVIMSTINYLLSLIKVINSKSLYLQVTLLNLFMVFLSPHLQSFIFKNKKKTEPTLS